MPEVINITIEADLLEDIAKEQWENISLIDDVDGQLNYFNCNFLRVLDGHAPVKTMKVRYRQSPFVDDEVKELMKKRDRLHRIARQTKSICDWNSFRVARNEVKEVLREAEKRYVRFLKIKNRIRCGRLSGVAFLVKSYPILFIPEI